ncbi:MAG: ADP-ribosylglycohydrolase family protein [Clostridia bacterium]|nr:ADP-ribosylglycohydrolase family protein [Clostridia bacterium]
MPTLSQSIRGCLFGGAAGDALGYAVEFLSWQQIQQRYGERGIQEYALTGGLAEVSDDTQMTLFTVLGMTHHAGRALYSLDYKTPPSAASALHWAYLAWLETQIGTFDPDRTWGDWLSLRPELWKWQAPGNTCLGALRSGNRGTIDRPINSSKGCGGVMRTAPCAFAPAGFAGDDVPDAETAMILGAQAAAITHGHPMGWISAGMLSDMIYRLVYQDVPTIEEAALASLGLARQLWPGAEGMDRLERLIRDALDRAHTDQAEEAAISALDPAWHGSGGWCGDDALAIALFAAARHPDSLTDALRTAVNHSGDSDSTGAVTGNLLGAKLGIQALPPRWIEPLDVHEALDVAAEQLAGIARIKEAGHA